MKFHVPPSIPTCFFLGCTPHYAPHIISLVSEVKTKDLHLGKVYFCNSIGENYQIRSSHEK